MKNIKKIANKYFGKKTTGWDIDNETQAIIVYGLDAIFLDGKYYDMKTGAEKRISEVNYIRDLRNNLKEGHSHDGIEGTGTGVIVHRKNPSSGKLEFLLQLRSDLNQYGLLGGGLELGSTYENCAVTELFEEAGIVANESALTLKGAYAGPKHITRYASGDLVFHTVIVYSVDYAECIQLDVDVDSETKALKWVSFDELKKMLIEEKDKFFPNNFPILWDVVDKYFVD